MSTDDYLLRGLRQHDSRAASFAEHHPTLVGNDFWERYLEVFSEQRDDPTKALAERLIGEGKTTFADVRAALDEYNAPQTKQ